MDHRLSAIFAAISSDEFSAVAGAVLGAGNVRAEHIDLFEIKKPHADGRTIGIVRVLGNAQHSEEARAWSCVAKVIDLAAPNPNRTPVEPRNEVLVYEQGHFVRAGGGLRPARCHHISRPGETVTILWLEDLTGARCPPFSADELSTMARHLGEWNAAIAARPPRLPFASGRDFQVSSWAGFNFPARVDEMLLHRDDGMTRDMYARQPLEIAREYVEVYRKLVERSTILPHALALADCPVSNFFHLPGETIAIDWAGLGSEPVGADGGRFIGSALTWGSGFAALVAHERELFDSYLEGMRAGGSTEDWKVVRAGYLSELAFYLCTIVTMPTIIAGPLAALPIEFMEKRFEIPMSELGAAAAPLIDSLPSYIDEMRELLA